MARQAAGPTAMQRAATSGSEEDRAGMDAGDSWISAMKHLMDDAVWAAGLIQKS